MATSGSRAPIARWASPLAAALFDGVRWIGPLFLANAAACLIVIAGLSRARTWALSAVAGVVVSALALGGLIVSDRDGLFGWQQSGLSTPALAAATTSTPKGRT